jgi:hypothetical protein
MTRLMRMVVAAMIKLYKSDRTTTIISEIKEIMISHVAMMDVVVVVMVVVTVICNSCGGRRQRLWWMCRHTEWPCLAPAFCSEMRRFAVRLIFVFYIIFSGFSHQKSNIFPRNVVFACRVPANTCNAMHLNWLLQRLHVDNGIQCNIYIV